jgi:hypothetical protein
MIDYSQYLLIINRMMHQVHRAAQANDFVSASNLAVEVARYAMSLSAVLDLKIETEV